MQHGRPAWMLLADCGARVTACRTAAIPMYAPRSWPASAGPRARAECSVGAIAIVGLGADHGRAGRAPGRHCDGAVRTAPSVEAIVRTVVCSSSCPGARPISSTALFCLAPECRRVRAPLAIAPLLRSVCLAEVGGRLPVSASRRVAPERQRASTAACTACGACKRGSPVAIARPAKLADVDPSFD